MNCTKKMAGLGAALVFSLAGTAAADEYHYTNILIGDRASGMGGAHTAVSDEPSGLYYNPAGIAYARTSNLSASVNAYNATHTTYKNALGGSRDWTRSSSSLLPNFFGIVQPLGKGVIGFSYAVPDTIIEDQDQVFGNFPSALPGIDVTSYTINFNQNDTTYKFGPSYAQDINEQWSWGMTLYYHYRDLQRIQNEYVILSDGRRQWTNSYLQSSEHGFQPILGLMWSPTQRLAVGLTLSQTLITSSTTTAQLAQESITGTSTPPTQYRTGDEREFPLQLRLGVAYFQSDRLLLAADIIHNQAYDYDYGGGKVKREAVTDIALGVEYYITGTLALRGGFYTSYANTPDIGSTAVNYEEHVDFIGFTGSISRYTRNSSLTFGLGYGIGSGHAQLFANTTNRQDVDSTALTAYLSTSYSY